MSSEQNKTTEKPVCECCGEPATRTSSDGVPLCDGDYQHLLGHWLTEGFDDVKDA